MGPDDDDLLGSSSEWTLVSTVPGEIAGLIPGVAPPRGKRILIVHEDATFRKLALRAVQVGFAEIPTRIKLLASGAQLLADLEVKLPDLVILDWDTTPTTGEQTLTRMRASVRMAPVRVVLVSRRLSRDDRLRAEELGVRDFVQRPVEFPGLVQTLVSIGIRETWLPPDAQPRLTR